MLRLSAPPSGRGSAPVTACDPTGELPSVLVDAAPPLVSGVAPARGAPTPRINATRGYAHRVTLILAIVAPWGIWQCSDYQLTKYRGKKIVGVADWSPKHLTLLCPDGACLMAYTGQAEASWTYRSVPVAPGATPPAHAAMHGRRINGTTSDWLMHTLSWETRTLDQSLLQVRDSANRVSTFRRGVTVFTAPCFLGGRVWFVQIANCRTWGSRPGQFENTGFEVTEPVFVVAGQSAAVSRRNIDRVNGIIKRRPAYPEDYFALLSDVNREAAKRSKDRLISPECFVSYMPPEGVPTSRHQETWGRPAPLESWGDTRILLNGINLDQASSAWRAQIMRQTIEAEARDREAAWTADPCREAMRAAALRRRGFRTRRPHDRNTRRKARRTPRPPASGVPSATP